MSTLQKFVRQLVRSKNKKTSINKFLGDEVEIEKWQVSQFINKKIVPIVRHSPFPFDELMMLVSTHHSIKPKYIFEWGTNIGKSARIFYETSKYFKLKTKRVSTDLSDSIGHQEHPGSKRGILVKNLQDVELLQGEGLETSLKMIKEKKLKNKKILFFLDGDHEYATVLNELNKISREVSRAIIIIHDTFFQTKESGYNIGPYKAVQKFMTDNSKHRKYSTNFGLPGVTALFSKK